MIWICVQDVVPAGRCARCKKIKSEFDMELGNRTAIYIPFPQAIPSKPVIDRENCILFKDARKKNIIPNDSKVCRKCIDACPIAPVKAIDYNQVDEIVEERVVRNSCSHRLS